MGSQHWSPGQSYECEPIGFWHVDVNELRPKLDPSMSALFGIDAADGQRGVEAQRLVDRIHPEDRTEARRGLLAAIADKGPYFYRYRLLQAGDGFRWVQARGRCFTDETGRPTHVAGILVEDIDASALPIEVAVAERLMTALDLAKRGGDPLLARLLEAVLLHAGREIAKGVDRSTLG